MGSFFTYSSCNQTALSGDTRAKARDVTPNVSYLRLRAHGGEGRGESAREKRSSLLSADTGASATKAEHEMSQIKKLKVSQPLRGKIPHHSHTTILPFGLDLIGAKCIFMK